ncbi:hypothetical protein [Sphingomonas oryzagri]
MSGILQALQRVCTHRDIVPVYFDRRTNSFIVTGVFGTHGGAQIFDSEGRDRGIADTKRAALQMLSANSN